MHKRTFFVVVLLLFITAFFLRVWPLQSTHWWDEAVYLQHAEIIFSGRGNYDEFIIRPPVLPLLIAAAYLVYHHAFAASILVAMLTSAGVVGMCLLGRELYDEKTGLIAGALLCFAPFIITTSHWIMTDATSLSFLIFAFLLLVDATKRAGGVLYFFSGVLFATAILTRFTALILLCVLPVHFFLQKERLRHIGYFLLGLLALFAPYLLWSKLRYGGFFTTILTAQSVVLDPVGDAWYYAKSFTAVFSLAICAGLLLYCVILVRRKAQASAATRRMELTLMLWSLLLIGYLSIIPHKEPRFIVPAAVPLIILAAVGYRHISPTEWHVSVLLGVLLLLQLFPSVPNYDQPFVNNEESATQRAGTYISTHYPGSIVYASHNYPVIAYYSGSPVIVVPYDDTFYHSYTSMMNSSGLFMYYDTAAKQPTLAWLRNNSAFRQVYASGDVLLFSFSAP